MPCGLPNMPNMPGFPPFPGMGEVPSGMPSGLPPFMGDAKNTEKPKNDFNVDELVKKIDAKIAEIEAEEKRIKEQ